MSAELDIHELDRIADKLPIQDLRGKKPSRAATAFCLVLACCACERVPAALFYRACQPRRQWHPSGKLFDSHDHLEKLPSWLLGLFRVQKAELSDSNDTLPLAPPSQSTLPTKSSPSQHPSKEFKLAESTPFYSRSSNGSGILLELLGIRPDDVQTFPTSFLLVPSDLEYLSDSQGVTVVTWEEATYFLLAETWKENILRTASEGLRICVWTLLATVAAYAMPIPYTEPLWSVFQFQLREVIESTVMPFLSVLDLRDIQEWSHILTEDILLLIIYHRFSAGTTGSRDPPLGPEISQYLRTTTLHDGRLTQLMLLVEWLEDLVSQSRISKSNFLAHLGSCSQAFLCDERLKFLILTSVDSVLSPSGCTFSAEIAAALREWWIVHLVFAGRNVDTISQCLWQSFHMAKDQISVPALMTTDVSVKSALGFALAERQHYRQAQSVLSACLSETHDLWPTDSPTRHLILAEFVNSSNLLGDFAQAESAARQAMQRSHVDSRFDMTCLKIALADSFISQSKYKMAIETLTEFPGNTPLSNDVLLRIALRLTKAKRRLAREAAMPTVDTNLIDWFVGAGEIPESLRVECLEEALSVVVDATRALADALTVGEVQRAQEAIQAHLARAPKNWRADAVREALDSTNPLSFKEGDMNTVNDQELPRDLSQAWDWDVNASTYNSLPPTPTSARDPILPQPGIVNLPSRELVVRVLAIGNSDLEDRVRELSGPVMYGGSFVPSERSRTGDVTSAFSTINISYQVQSEWSDSVDFAVIQSWGYSLASSLGGVAGLMRDRIRLRKAGFIRPIVALVPFLDDFDDIVVNVVDGGYGRGYDGYLEEPLERERLALLIRYYYQASDYGITAQRSFPYAPLVFNDEPRMVLLPADYPKSSAFAGPNTTPYLIHEANVSRDLSLALDYGLRLNHSVSFPHLFGNGLEYHGFVVPTQAFREADQKNMGYQMIHFEVAVPNEPTFRTSETILSLITGCGKQPNFLRTSERLDVNLVFGSKSMTEEIEIRLSSERMREYQVDSLEISRICIRRIIEQYTRRQTLKFIRFFAGMSTREHGARYLVTGYRTYLDPVFTRLSRFVEDDREESLYISGDSVAAMQLCEISLYIDNSTRPSEADIRNIPKVRVGEPQWYVLWGPMSSTDDPWPPSSYMEDEDQPDIVKVGSRPIVDDMDYIEYFEGDTYKEAYMPLNRNRTSKILATSIDRLRSLGRKLKVD